MFERIGRAGNESGVVRRKRGEGLVGREGAEQAFEASGDAGRGRGRSGERHEAGEGVAGSRDDDFFAGLDTDEEAGELGLGFVDVDDGGQRVRPCFTGAGFASGCHATGFGSRHCVTVS